MKITTPALLSRTTMALAIGLSLFQATDAFARGNGIAGYSGETNDCTSCHGGNAAKPSVTLSGPASATAGSTNSYTLTITGGPAMSAGLDVSVSGGTLVVTGSTATKLSSGEIVHSSPGSFSGGSSSYSFDWQAPNTAGTYTIYAAGFSGDGSGTGGDGTSTTTMAITVAAAANQPPVANITGPASGTEGVAVTFDGSGSSDPDGTIASYDWDFGDTTTGTGATPSHTYNTAGTYTVTLMVTDNAGATNSATASITIDAAGTPVAPTANAGGPYTGMVGADIQFDGSASTDPDGSIASYDWDFGDGSTGTGATPTHAYSAAGSYAATLTVTDNTAMTGSSQADVTITANNPTPDPVPTPNPVPTTGQQLYDDNCASCHGAGGRGGPDGPVLGDSASDIMEAIQDVNVMNGLANTLGESDINAIADYLNGRDGTTTPAPTENRYEKYCSSCHGAGGVGGPDGDVIGTSVGNIIDAIEEVPEMQSLADVLGRRDIWIIARYLSVDSTQQPAPSENLYEVYCAGCHGPGGRGGRDGSVVGESLRSIKEAINEERAMNFLQGLLSDSQIQSIVDYLSNAPQPQAPVTTSNLYDQYCAACHGADGVGGPDGSVLGESAGDISEAIREVPDMQSLASLTRSQIQEIAQFLSQGSRNADDEEGSDRDGVRAFLPQAEDSGSISMAELYNLNCAACHGVDGLGGTKDAPIVNASAKAIGTALQQEPDMMFLNDTLTSTDVKRISIYLDRAKSDNSSAAANDTTDSGSGGGMLSWVTLLSIGAWLGLRRRRKSHSLH